MNNGSFPQNPLKVMRVDSPSVCKLYPLIEEKEEIIKVGAELVDIEAATDVEIIASASDADVIFTNSANFSREVIQSMPKLRAIIRCGVGYDVIDVRAATENGILVVNIPDYCIDEASNHAITLLLAVVKKLVLLDGYVRRNLWDDAQKILAPMPSVYGQILGVIGCGNLGLATARKARCLNMMVLGYDHHLDKYEAAVDGIELTSLEDLLQKSDFISIHLPLNKETFHFIGEKELKKMKSSAYLINTARGAVVDESALIKALQEKWIAGAGLDVFETEPVTPDNPLITMDNVILTPHTASYSDAAFKKLRISVGQEAARIVLGKWPKNVVNKDVKPKIIFS